MVDTNDEWITHVQELKREELRIQIKEPLFSYKAEFDSKANH
jgi:hypothetical protein